MAPAFLFLAGWMVLGGQTPADAQQPSASRFDAFLANGEFAPARQLADAQPDAAVRDQWLARMATAQAAAGSRRASMRSLSDIGDDHVLGGALDDIGSQMLGGEARGGAALADFDSLIELITSTIAPDSWEEVGGAGAIEPFPGGVYVDPAGQLKRVEIAADGLQAVRHESRRRGGNRDVRVASSLRKVSLNRLERQLQMQALLGRGPGEDMQLLAGLSEVRYVFVYPDTGDIVLAGPAGDWRYDGEGRPISVDTGRPLLRLDDLVVLIRNAFDDEGRFGCSITPRAENLAATQAFLKASAETSLPAGGRERWLGELRDTVGQQDISVFGIDPRSRVAHVIVEADYRMKLVGMGLEDGTLGVTSYLDSIKAGTAPPEMSVLRWWFTLNYDAVKTTPDRNAFELHGQGVKVLSENEMLTERGERVHTGKSDVLNLTFAASFTKHFPSLAAKYPIYAELKNVFDLALVAAIIREQDLAGQLDWPIRYWRDPQGYAVSLGSAPEEVESVVNHRLLSRSRFVAGVSGGVNVDTSQLVSRDQLRDDDYGALHAQHHGHVPRDLPRDAWWWD